MKGKLLQKLTAVILIACMTMVNFIFVAANVVYAVSDKAAEVNIDNGKITFDAYFKNNSGNKVYSKQTNISEGATLYASINLSAGKLNDAKITFNNPNFKLPKSIENEYVKSVNQAENTIYLKDNKLDAGYINTVNIEIPVTFEKQATMNVDYFNRDNGITLSGKYFNSSENGKDITTTITTNLQWYGDKSVNFTDKFEKTIFEDNRVIIQEKLTSNTENLPKVSETIKITTPKVLGENPNKVVILKNGVKVDEEKVNAAYNSSTGALDVTFDFIQNNIIDWSYDTDTYKIIYIYNQSVSDVTTAITKGTAQVIPTIFGYEDRVEGSKVFETYPGYNYGNIVSVEAKALSTNVYKGFMYSNSNELTEFDEQYNVEVSDLEGINQIDLNSVRNKFSNGTITDKVAYTQITVNKANMEDILGQNGTITIANAQGEQLATIDNTSAEDERTVDINSNSIKITTTAPVKEGVLSIKAKRTITGNAGLTTAEVNQINSVISEIKVTTNKDDEGLAVEATTELKEPTTKPAELTITPEQLLTSNVNTMEFQVKLPTGTQDTYLFKKPTITLTLPEDVVSITNATATALYAGNELSDISTTVNGKQIVVAINGEQTTFDNKIVGGIIVKINANVELNKSAKTKSATVTMAYTNENDMTTPEPITKTVVIESQDKILENTVVSGSKEDGNVIFKTTLTNAKDKAIENIGIIGAILNKETIQADFENNIKGTFKTDLTNEGLEITYSSDKENWNNTMENANYFKITIKSSVLNPEATANIEYTMNNVYQLIPEFKLAYTIEGNGEVIDLSPEYTYNGGVVTVPDQPQSEEQPVAETEKIKVGVSSTAEPNSEVYVGQTIKYTYTIENLTQNELKNIKLSVNHENVNVYAYNYDNERKDQADTANPGEMLEFVGVEEIEGKTNFEKTITSLSGRTKAILTYQVRVKDEGQVTAEATITGDEIDEIKLEKLTYTAKAAELKLELLNNERKGFANSLEDKIGNILKITNTSGKKLENVLVSMSVPEDFKIFDVYNYNDKKEVDYTIINKTDKMISINLPELDVNGVKEIVVVLEVVSEKNKKASVSFAAQVNEHTYFSNEVEISIMKTAVSQLEMEQTASVQGDSVKNGDKLVYNFRLKNIGEYDDCFTIVDEVPRAAVVKKVYYKIGDKTTEVEQDDNTITENIVINKGEEANLTIEAQIDEEQNGDKQITNVAVVHGMFMKETSTNEITYKLATNVQIPDDEEEPEDDEGKYNVDNDLNDNSQGGGASGETTIKNSISGLTWLDENKNGIRESSEKTLSGIQVILANTETGEYVKDEEGKIIVQTTDSEGKYSFKNISQGKYMVIFKYDNVKYRNTKYKVSGATDSTNSDIITSKVSINNDQTKYGMTDTLELKDISLEHIDAGFIKNEIFDLKLDKYISKVTVQNSAGTIVKEYNNQQLAKIEIDAKALAASTVLIEYTMKVTNEGELGGYANEIVDYIPKDLNFNSEINKQWYKSTDGNIHTTALAKELINPGESQEVKLILTKTMTENNTGLTTNNAEIVKSSNDASIPDKDSTSGNNLSGEDDLSTAELIISIRTGIGFTIGIITAIIAIAVAGVVFYTKKRKEANHE